jgi:branched-chain amino acid aminotransferase
MLYGNGAQLGLGPAPEYTFAMVQCPRAAQLSTMFADDRWWYSQVAVPVGSYYKTGLKAVDGLVIEKYDRAAPHGIGNIKAAGALFVLPSARCCDSWR